MLYYKCLEDMKVASLKPTENTLRESGALICVEYLV